MLGLSFANPAMLYGLWAALVPIVIHLLNRRRTVTVSFSNVALIQSLQQDRMRRVRLKQWLLLLLRTLLIAFLALAFARPTLRTVSSSGGTHTSAVVLIDQSLSSRHAGVFEVARARVNQLLPLFESQDDLRVIAFDDRAELVGDGAVDDVRMAARDLAPGYGGTDILPALELAGSLMEESDHLNREVYVLSDFASSGWGSVPDSVAGLAGSTVYVVQLVTPPVDNVSIQDVRPLGGLLGVGLRASLMVTLVNHGETPRTEVGVDITVDGRRIARRLVSVWPGTPVSLDVPFTPEAGGDLVVQAELSHGDDLPDDDVRRSVVHVPAQVRVALIGHRDDRYFVKQALASEGHGTATHVADVLTAEALVNTDVIVLWAETLSSSQVEMLARHVEGGGGLWIFLGHGVDTRVFNERVLPRLAPGRLVGVEGRPGGETHVRLKPPAGEHVLVHDLVGAEMFRSPVFQVRYRLKPDPAVSTLMSYTDGAPALLEWTLGLGRVLLLTSHTDPEWSDLSVSGLFVPLVYRATRYLASGQFGRSDFISGNQVTRLVTDPDEREGQLHAPDGTVRAIWTENRGSRRVWDVGMLHQPGIYQIHARGRRVDLFAVNVPAEESDLSAIGLASISSVFAGAEVVEVSPAADLDALVRSRRHGQELWKPLLLIALAVMAAELWIVGGERRSR